MKMKAIILVIIAGIAWGTSGIFVHYLAPYGFTSVQMTAVRGIVSLISMTLFALICDRKSFRTDKIGLLLSLGSGVSLFLTATLYYEAMQRIGIAPAAIIMYSMPVIVTLLSGVIFKERATALKWVALGVMLLGCALSSGLISGIGWKRGEFYPVLNLKIDFVGLLIAAMSAITYSVYNILTKLAARRGENAITLTIYCFLAVSVSALVCCNPVALVKAIAVNPKIALPLCLGLGAITFVLPFFLYTLGIKSLPASTATALSVMEPVSAAVFGLFLGESLSPVSLIGIILAVIAVLLIVKSENNVKSEGKCVERSL